MPETACTRPLDPRTKTRHGRSLEIDPGNVDELDAPRLGETRHRGRGSMHPVLEFYLFIFCFIRVFISCAGLVMPWHQGKTETPEAKGRKGMRTGALETARGVCCGRLHGREPSVPPNLGTGGGGKCVTAH